MALASLLSLLDDISAVLDDVALMSKMAAKKTAGVVGDDLALNAHQVTGVQAERELPVVWAVAKGSFWNKALLIPLALLLARFLPQAITPLLMLGGAYLCFEGFEKILPHHAESASTVTLSEAEKIRGAIRTDFILSAEIIVIALGELEGSAFLVQILALSLIGLGMTVFVYGLVACIVKADDLGFYWQQRRQKIWQALGKALLWLMPRFMRALSWVGLLAMFLVGGGIFSHRVEALHHWAEALPVPFLFDLIIGLAVGALCYTLQLLWQKSRAK